MKEVFQTIERFYLSRKRYPKFFNTDMEDSMKMFITGCCYPLAGRDSDGRKIVMIHVEKWDINEFSNFDATRLLCYINMVLCEEEETQIAGVKCVFDYTYFGAKDVMALGDFTDFIDFSIKCANIRQGGNYFVKLPMFLSFLLEIGKSMLSKKMKKRIHVIKSFDELKAHIDPSMLPLECGGKIPQSLMMQEFVELHEKHLENLRKITNFKVDYSKVSFKKVWSNNDSGDIDSFGNLKID